MKNQLKKKLLTENLAICPTRTRSEVLNPNGGSMFVLNSVPYCQIMGHAWRSWLRNCGTSRKVTGSIPDDVIGIFH